MVFREIVAFAFPRSLPRLLAQRESFSSIASNASRHSHTSQTSAVVGESTPPAPLLLEGDEFFVSNDGIARTFYELESSNSAVAIEELYDLKHASKEFVLRAPPAEHPVLSNGVQVLGRQVQGIVSMGSALASIKLQEIDEGPFGAAGTGATTWEASIAMALHFRSNPEQLLGNVVEVGCGVGLGGILNQMWRDVQKGYNPHESMTLTDGNDHVIKQCQKNVNSNSARIPALNSSPPIEVSRLDWNDFLCEDTSSNFQSYDTVIACDCAYLYTSIEALGKTLHGLLNKSNPSARVHMFGPYNRSAFHEVIRYLKDELNMEVVLDWIDMSRYRLKPGKRDASPLNDYVRMDDCVYASNAKARFLHVRAYLKTETDTQQGDSPAFSDID